MSTSQNIYIAIMAGGAGTRFWPKSRSDYPKQFLDILKEGETLLQATFRRNLSLVDKEHIFVVTNKQYASIVREQLPDIPAENILTEPLRKNTAPCLVYISYLLQSQGKQGTLISLPADHYIKDEEAYLNCIKTGVSFCEQNDALLTLGILPHMPHTGYGYIQMESGRKGNEAVNNEVYKVKTFTEKPSLEIAKQFIDTGEFLWNAGIFIWNIQSGINAMKTHMSQEIDVFERHFPSFLSASDFAQREHILLDIFEKCRNISIDYALLEKAKNVYVINGSFSWNDLGSWTSIYELKAKDDHKNAGGEKSAILLNTRDCLIEVNQQKLVFIDGLEDYIVVDTEQALLICKKEKTQQIKDYLDIIKERGKKDYL